MKCEKCNVEMMKGENYDLKAYICSICKKIEFYMDDKTE